MVDAELIDAHVHLHKNLDKERQALPIPGRRDRDRWGHTDSIIPYMDREGVTHAVALNLFPTPFIRRALRDKIPDDVTGQARAAAEAAIEADMAARLVRHNEWLTGVSQREPRIVAGIGIQKLLTPDEMVREVEERAAQGARAVKLLPGFFREFPNDEAFWPMYARCQELGVVVVSDTGSLGVGEHRAYPGEVNDVCYGEPRLFEDVLASFPDLTLVMAHFPSASWDQRVDLAQRYDNLMFDISGGFHSPGFRARDADRAIPETDAVRVMRAVGMERFMFGSDGPHVMLQPYIEQVLRLDLTPGELDVLLTGNARRVFRIEP